MIRTELFDRKIYTYIHMYLFLYVKYYNNQQNHITFLKHCGIISDSQKSFKNNTYNSQIIQILKSLTFCHIYSFSPYIHTICTLHIVYMYSILCTLICIITCYQMTCYICYIHYIFKLCRYSYTLTYTDI